MNFEQSEDRRMLADSLDRFISDASGIDRRNNDAYGSVGFSLNLYKQVAELGALAALFPEANGGLGGTGFDVATVFESIGRGILPGPFLEALIVGQAIITSDAERYTKLLSQVISGDLLVCFAHDEPGSHYELANVTTVAEKHPSGWLLSGRKSVARYMGSSDLLLVSARTSGDQHDREGISLFLVKSNTPGIQSQSYQCFDGGQAADVTFHNVAIPDDCLLGALGEGYTTLERIYGYASLALSAEALGAMDVAKHQTLDYLRTRKQFGAAIGTFQSLQHRMADVLLEVEQARSAVINASYAIDAVAAGPVREQALSAAKYTTGTIGTRVAEEGIQLHGGIGMTWELPLAHFAKRLVMINHQFGDEDFHLARYIELSRLSESAAPAVHSPVHQH
jgi:alkylation response protein AidB-like acyl-CoA dehydrogenase